MIKFEFESHEATPEDQYVKEIVTFKFTAEGESFYVPYFHKTTKEGGTFWSPASAGVQVYGKKKYFDGFMLDSRHRTKLVMDFLTERRWERPIKTEVMDYYPHGIIKKSFPDPSIPPMPPTSMDEVGQNDQLPF
jgi:hypothetical protein